MVFNLNDIGLWFELPTELDELSWYCQPVVEWLVGGLDHFSSLGLSQPS